MKFNTITKISRMTLLLLLSLSQLTKAQLADSVQQQLRFKPLRMGMRYQTQDFQQFNQTSGDCNCAEGERISYRGLQGIMLSMYEPINRRWAIGADFGGAFGQVMDDAKQYSRQSYLQTRLEGFYELFDPSARLRPYLSAAVQWSLHFEMSHSNFSLPIGVGLRFKLDKGAYLHLQTAYDAGIGSRIAKSQLSQIGFHVPIYQRPKDSELFTQVNSINYDQLKAKVNVDKVENLELPILEKKDNFSRIIYFQKNKVRFFSEQAKNDLGEVIEKLIASPTAQVKLVGFNPQPRRKVKMVYRYLVNNEISTDRIAISYYRKSLSDRLNNKRRVEITVE